MVVMLLDVVVFAHILANAENVIPNEGSFYCCLLSNEAVVYCLTKLLSISFVNHF